MYRNALVAALVCMLMVGLASAAGPISVDEDVKPRVVTMTDIGGDPDDRQSMVRFLLYSCDFDVEGLCTGFGWGHRENTRPDLIRKAVNAYGKVLPNLRKHRSDYPSADHLMDLIKDGHNGDPHKVGPGMDSAASNWIIKVLKKDDPRPVWFGIWGGPRELAQALWRMEKDLPKKEFQRLKDKIRIHSIADQDKTAEWIKKNHPDIFYIYSGPCFRGIWNSGDQSIVSPAWLKKNVLTNHGPLGDVYPPKAAGKDGVKEGDTPSFFYVLPNGLSDPEHPEWGGWGGRFRPSGRGNEYRDASDKVGDVRDSLATIYRWREHYQNAFEARMDWCVKSWKQANHCPNAVLNGDRTLDVLKVSASPGEKIRLSAKGSSDPDGDGLRYHWWVYPEPGSYWGDAQVHGAKNQSASVTVPEEASGRTIHVILEVTDRGNPPLTAYRRAILEVSGQPVAPPPDVPLTGADLERPVKHLPGPPKNKGPWEFYRGINVNGKPVTIDGNKWQGDDASNFECDDTPLVDPDVRLYPPTDDARNKMIHSFRWEHNASLKLTSVPRGRYAVYAYVWEETGPTSFTISLEGKDVRRYNSGSPGEWRRLGPWIVDIKDGDIHITSRDGDANFSGIEVWRKK